MYQLLDVLVVWCPSGQFCSGLSDSQLAKVDVNDPTKQKIFKFETTEKLLFPREEKDFPNGVFKGDFKGKFSLSLNLSTIALTLALTLYNPIPEPEPKPKPFTRLRAVQERHDEGAAAYVGLRLQREDVGRPGVARGHDPTRR